jgi:hypothetical protein
LGPRLFEHGQQLGLKKHATEFPTSGVKNQIGILSASTPTRLVHFTVAQFRGNRNPAECLNALPDFFTCFKAQRSFRGVRARHPAEASVRFRRMRSDHARFRERERDIRIKFVKLDMRRDLGKR